MHTSVSSSSVFNSSQKAFLNFLELFNFTLPDWITHSTREQDDRRDVRIEKTLARRETRQNEGSRSTYSTGWLLRIRTFFSPWENRCISITNDIVEWKVWSVFDSSFPWLRRETGTEFLSPAVPEISVFTWELREKNTIFFRGGFRMLRNELSAWKFGFGINSLPRTNAPIFFRNRFGGKKCECAGKGHFFGSILH